MCRVTYCGGAGLIATDNHHHQDNRHDNFISSTHNETDRYNTCVKDAVLLTQLWEH